jgi:Fe2+ transport system protein FeoA
MPHLCPHSDVFKVLGFKSSPGLSERLKTLGFHVGTEFSIWKQNIFGKTFILLLHNQLIALRKAEFECLLYKKRL